MQNDYLSKLYGFEGKIALVTGATGQLGREICRGFVDAGLEVIGVDKNLNDNKMIGSAQAEYIHTDIADKESVTNLFEQVYDKYGRLDVLINNAGVSVFEPYEKRPEKSFDWVMDVNLKGTFFCIQEYSKRARQRKHKGSIVNIGSMYGIISPDFRIYTDCDRKSSEVYGASKAGVIQMTCYFAVHLADYDIRVNCVSPGGIFNPESPQGKDFIKQYSFRCPMGRMAETREMIGGILYLSSDAASYTTGQNIVIDGGMSCW